MKHTPLPWHYNDSSEGVDSQRGIWKEIAYIRHCKNHDENHEMSVAEAMANAEFITKAVNSHYYFIRACEYTLNTLEAAYKEKLIKATKHFHIHFDESIKLLKQALQRAEGGE